MQRNKCDSLVRAYYVERMPQRIKDVIGAANSSLHFGGGDALCELELGFESAMEELFTWWDEQPHEVWLDTQCEEVCDKAPEGYTDDDGEYVEPMWEDFIQYELREIKRAVFGELGEYVNRSY
jgi:hypothetical protein